MSTRTSTLLEASTLRGRATASGHHGELCQGFVDGAAGPRAVLVSLPCAHYRSHASVELGPGRALTVSPGDRSKSLAAATLALAAVGLPEFGGEIRIETNIPIGWGLGSSTSDVVAVIRAVFVAAGLAIDAPALGRLAVAAEVASDSTMFADVPVLFAQREGVVVEEFAGPLPTLEVFGLNTAPGLAEGIDTLSVDTGPPAAAEIAEFRRLLDELGSGIARGDRRAVAAAATRSARLHQPRLTKLQLEPLIRIAEELGALGVQVAHSGIVVGLLFDPDDDDLDARIDDARLAAAELGLLPSVRFTTRSTRP